MYIPCGFKVEVEMHSSIHRIRTASSASRTAKRRNGETLNREKRGHFRVSGLKPVKNKIPFRPNLTRIMDNAREPATSKRDTRGGIARGPSAEKKIFELPACLHSVEISIAVPRFMRLRPRRPLPVGRDRDLMLHGNAVFTVVASSA